MKISAHDRIRLLLLIAAAVILLSAAAPARAAHRVERDILIDKHGGVELYGDMWVPEGKGPFPGILFFHGGGFVGGKRSDSEIDRLIAYYADNGYAVFSADYRLLRDGGIFPNNVKDGKCALAWLKKNGARYGVDTGRIGVMGESAGAYMAAMVAAAPNDAYFMPECGSIKDADMSVKAGVMFYAPYNFASIKGGFAPILEIELRRAMNLKTKKETEEYKAKNSPITYASVTPPMILINSEKDGLVDPRQGDEMADALKKAGMTFEHIIEDGPGIDHGFALDPFDSPQSLDARERGLAWLDKYLKNAK
jgi:acetyl esterase/lipase